MSRTERAWVAICCLLGFVLTTASWVNAVNAGGSPVASVVIEPQEKGKDFVVTFAHPFKKGDIKDTLAVAAGAEEIPTQVNVKRRYSDGSVKHAIISAFISDAAPGLPLTLDIYPSSEQPAAEPNPDSSPAAPTRVGRRGGRGDVPPQGVLRTVKSFSAGVVFRFPDGSRHRANAAEFYRKAVRGNEHFRLIKWLEGPLVTEVQLAGPPSASNGDLDPDLLVLFGLRFLAGRKAPRVEVVVESPWVDVPGNIPYDIMVSVGGKEVLARANVGHWHHRMPYWLKDRDRNLGHFAHARWRKIFWRGNKPPETHIRYQLPYLVSTSFLPPYDTDQTIS